MHPWQIFDGWESDFVIWKSKQIDSVQNIRQRHREVQSYTVMASKLDIKSFISVASNTSSSEVPLRHKRHTARLFPTIETLEMLR